MDFQICLSLKKWRVATSVLDTGEALPQFVNHKNMSDPQKRVILMETGLSKRAKVSSPDGCRKCLGSCSGRLRSGGATRYWNGQSENLGFPYVFRFQAIFCNNFCCIQLLYMPSIHYSIYLITIYCCNVWSVFSQTNYIILVQLLQIIILYFLNPAQLLV